MFTLSRAGQGLASLALLRRRYLFWHAKLFEYYSPHERESDSVEVVWDNIDIVVERLCFCLSRPEDQWVIFPQNYQFPESLIKTRRYLSLQFFPNTTTEWPVIPTKVDSRNALVFVYSRQLSIEFLRYLHWSIWWRLS